MANISVTCETTVYLAIDGKKHKLTREGAQQLVSAVQAALRDGTPTVALVTPRSEAESDPRGRYGAWAKAEEQQLRAALMAGRPVENVAKSLNRSVASCERKAEEVGLVRQGGGYVAIAAAAAD